MSNYVRVDPTQHGEVKILPHANFKHAAAHHHVPLTANEFGHASSSYPLVFMKDAQQGQFRAVAMLGLLAGKNVFFTEDEWLGVYVPAAILRAPFELGPDPQQAKTLTLYIDEDSDYVSKNQGEALFDGGEASQFLQQVQKNIADYYQHELASHKFVAQLLEHNLLKEIELLVEFDDQQRNRIKGLYTINEEVLAQLPGTVLVDFHKQNYLMPIHAMLASLIQLNRLMKLHNSSAQQKITAIQMRASVGEE
jgi:hypothetical protein